MRHRLLAVVLASALAGGLAFAQVGRGGSEWLTALGDAQRTSWIRTDDRISVETMSRPGFELQWTSALENDPRQLHGLAQGVTANGVTLFVPMSVVAGSSNNVYALDNDTGYVVWQRRFDAPMAAPTPGCPGGITSAATRIVSLVPPPLAEPGAGRRGRGRGAVGYRSVLGEPGQGVPVDENGVNPGRAVSPPPPPGQGRGRRGAPPAPAPELPPSPVGRTANPAGIPGAPADIAGGGLARVSGVAYAISSDGMLHVMGLQTGKDLQPPAQLLPPNARWTEPIAVGTRLFAATSGRCGGAPDGVWAIDLESESKPVVSWRTNGGPVVGAVALATDGKVIAAIGAGQTSGDGKANAIVALDPRTLELRDWFTHPTAEFVTGPTIFRHGDREIVAAGTRDGRILLLDAASLGGGDRATALYASQPMSGGTFAAEALATWQDANGARWILASITGRVLALKLVEAGGAVSLESGWSSQDLDAPATPIVVNGVVFALDTGRPAAAGAPGTPAVLHAYEGSTGRPLWNSGQAMKTFASSGSFWSAMGQAYVGTHDGTLYAFGFLDERR
jgi:outer membrane protein assembly factor BamB